MKREIILSTLVFLLMISLFLPVFNALKVIIIGLLVLATLLDDSFKQKLLLFKERKYVWFMLAFAALLFLSFIFSDNQSDGARALQLRFPLVIFPVSLALIRLPQNQRNRILLGAAFIVALACFTSLLYAITRYWENNNTAWLYNDALTYFVGQQSIYTSVLVNIAIYVLAYHLFYTRASRRLRFLIIITLVFLFIISYLLASRNMMLILYAATLIFSFYSILTKRKWLQGAALLLGLVIAGFLIFRFFPKTINRFKELAYTQFNFQSQAKESHYAGELSPDQWNGANFRLAAWQCGWQLFKEHPLTGVGLGDKRDELFRVYRQKQFHFAIATNKNVHNNYLDILYSLGVAGLLLFLTGWIIIPLVMAIRQRDGLAALVIITFALAMITESYFDRSIGGILFGFFIPFMLTSLKSDKSPPRSQ